MDLHTHPDNDLTCRELVELVTDYLEQALSPTERARFERHLSECDGCRNYLDQIRRTIAATGRLHADAISDTDRMRMLTLFRGLRNTTATEPGTGHAL